MLFFPVGGDFFFCQGDKILEELQLVFFFCGLCFFDVVFSFEQFHSLKLTAKAPENGPSQKKIHLPIIHFQVLLV